MKQAKSKGKTDGAAKNYLGLAIDDEHTVKELPHGKLRKFYLEHVHGIVQLCKEHNAIAKAKQTAAMKAVEREIDRRIARMNAFVSRALDAARAAKKKSRKKKAAKKSPAKKKATKKKAGKK